jgi:hypothetical protein
MKHVTQMPTPVAEASVEWREAQMLRLIEGVRFNPERLAAYVGLNGDVGFLDFLIERFGGRSQ